MTLKIKVQVDRMPDIEVGEHAKSQLGLRVSAVVAGAASAEDRDLLLPWHWRRTDLAGAWSIHDAANWRLWLLRAGALTEILPANWRMAVSAPAAFDPAPAAVAGAAVPIVGRFHQRLEDEVTDILAEVGLHALEEPTEGMPISGRTVFGLVESLTTLPAPVPAGMQLWTAITLDTLDLAITEDDQFIAAPRFAAPSDAVFTLETTPVAVAGQTDGWRASYTVVPADPLREAEAWLHPSLPMTILGIKPTDTQRLIDLSNLLVRQAGPNFEANDWHATLANRIAEALDPSARVMAVLDETIRTVLAKIDDRNSATVKVALAKELPEPLLVNAVRESLRRDLVPAAVNGNAPDRLRATLAALHAEVVAPRARNSRTSAAPAAAFLERMAIRDPALWPKVAPLLFAQGGAETSILPPPSPRHQVVSRARLAGAASIVAPRQDYLDDPVTTPVIDDERAFQAWLFEHWTSQPSAWTLAPGARLLFGASARFLQQETGAPATVTATDQEIGVINLMDLPAGTSFSLPLSLSAGAAVGAPIAVELLLAERKEAFFRLELKATAADQLALTVGADVQQLQGTLENISLQLDFALSQKAAGGKQVMLAYKLTIGAQPPAGANLDITAFAQKGRVALALTAGAAALTVGLKPAAALLTSGEASSATAGQGQPMRAALALAHAGPAIGGLLGGWVPVAGHVIAPEDEKSGLVDQSLRLRMAIERYVNDPGGFQQIFDRATAAAGTGQARIDEITASLKTATPTQQGALSDELTLLNELLKPLWEAAKQDAIRLAARLVPAEHARDADGLTQDAAPLTFLIDQLQDFDDSVDLSARMAGPGAWIGRSNQPAPVADQWWSLNVATLHVSQPDPQHAHARAPLGEGNAVQTRVATNWALAALVDPVAMVVSETQGVRNALIRYESQSIVAEVQKRPQMDPRGQAARFARRPEAFLFPVDIEFPKLPPLTFGRYYHVLPYLIGHGGAVPPVFRSKVEDPCSWLGKLDQSGRVRLPAGLENNIRTKHYLRTVPVAPPRLSNASYWPGPIEGVAALAAELAPVPPPVTLRVDAPARFFMDAAHTAGMLTGVEAISNGVGGIRIELGGLLPSAGTKLRLTAVNLGESAPLVVLQVEFDCAPLMPAAGQRLGLRVDVCGPGATTSLLRQDPGACAEDAPFAAPIEPLSSIVLPVSEWQHCAIELESLGGNIELMPPSIRWGTAVNGALTLMGELGVYPAELVSQNQPISILDGIGKPGTRVDSRGVTIVLKRPSTTLATYDRWVNGVLGDYGSGGADLVGGEAAKKAAQLRVRKALNVAASVATAPRAGERSLDDPAVESLWMEVVQIFPQYKVTQALVQIGSRFNEIDNLLGIGNRGHGADWANIAIAVDDHIAGAPAAGTYAPNKPLYLPSGSVYELRFYGAIAAVQPWFASAGVSNRDRFSPAVSANWRDRQLSGASEHLGAPLVLKVEVASDLMPEWYPDAARDDAAALPFGVTLRRPPEVERECAAIALNPDYKNTPSHVLERYQALRMVDRVGLLEQRWSWRGRPQAELAAGVIEHFGETELSPKARDFVEAAFFGRRHDDIGAIPEMRIARAHAYAGRDQFAQAVAPRRPPTVLESDLDYRGGANLWRFALRAKSRYAALRPNNPSAMLRFSHTKVHEDAVYWWPLIVPDRADPRRPSRKPQRPNLMLVIPLTDGMDEGGGVPPLLALFNEKMFALSNAADAIEAVVELARHPYPAVERVNRAAGVGGGSLEIEWKRLVTARDELVAAKRALANLLRADQRTVEAELTAARKKVSERETACELAGDTYATYLGTATAAGYEEQLKDMKAQVTASKAEVETALAKETAKPLPQPAYVKQLKAGIARFEVRLKEIQAEIDHLPAASPEADGRGLGSPFAKVCSEYAPDTIRTGRGASGEPLAMRVDGPIGYSFDGEVEAGRFDHAGLLLTPVAPTVEPWSMVKLRFRRLELPELLVGKNGKSMFLPLPLDVADVGANRFQLSSELPKRQPEATPLPLLADPVPIFFETSYEGLVIDLVKPESGPGRVQMSLDHPITAAVKLHLWVEATVTVVDGERRLLIQTGTQLGEAASWSRSVASDAGIEVRLIVAPKAVPISGNDILPVGEVSVRVRISNDAVAEQSADNAWLSVICMPLTAGASIPAGLAPVLYLHGGGKATSVNIGPVRLSEFTPGVWCQFAAPMSRLRVAATLKSKSGVFEISHSLAVTELRAIASQDGSRMTLSLAGLGKDESVQTILLSADGAPDPDAQIEECLYAVVTRYVYDAFGRMRERSLSIHRLPARDESGTPVLGQPSWRNPAEASTAALFAAGSGRIRILHVLRGKARDKHGFEAAPREFPDDFFGTDVEPGTAVDENPFDAAGQVLGISKPFEWQTAT